MHRGRRATRRSGRSCVMRALAAALAMRPLDSVVPHRSRDSCHPLCRIVTLALRDELSLGFTGIFHRVESLKFDVVEFVVDLLHLADIDVLDDVAGFRIDRYRTTRT